MALVSSNQNLQVCFDNSCHLPFHINRACDREYPASCVVFYPGRAKLSSCGATGNRGKEVGNSWLRSLTSLETCSCALLEACVCLIVSLGSSSTVLLNINQPAMYRMLEDRAESVDDLIDTPTEVSMPLVIILSHTRSYPQWKTPFLRR